MLNSPHHIVSDIVRKAEEIGSINRLLDRPSIDDSGADPHPRLLDSRETDSNTDSGNKLIW